MVVAFLKIQFQKNLRYDLLVDGIFRRIMAAVMIDHITFIVAAPKSQSGVIAEPLDDVACFVFYFIQKCLI